MPVRSLSNPSVTRVLGATWDVLVDVRDADGDLVDSVPVVTVTAPTGPPTTPTVETIATGVYRAAPALTAVGRYIVHVAATNYGAVDLTAFVQSPTYAGSMPSISDFASPDGYLGEHSWSSDQLTDALNTEAAAQRARCRVGAIYPADMREALMRRVQCNLARRAYPLSITNGGGETDSVFLPGNDPEVRRLEAPYRKRIVG